MNSQESSQQVQQQPPALESMETEATLVGTQEAANTNTPSQSTPAAAATPQAPQATAETTTTTTEATETTEKAAVDKEKEMAELLMTMDNYKAIIPDAVIDYYLNKTGFDCDDARIKKLFALAAQKFVADIASDAFQYNKIRQASNKSTASSKSTTKANREKKVVLTMDDLSLALNEYGVNMKKPDYYS